MRVSEYRVKLAYTVLSGSKFDKVKSRSMVGTLRAASENYKQGGRCTQFPNVAMEIATLTRHRLTSQSIFHGPRSPYIAEVRRRKTIVNKVPSTEGQGYE